MTDLRSSRLLALAFVLCPAVMIGGIALAEDDTDPVNSSPTAETSEAVAPEIAAGFEIPWSSIDGGGSTMDGGTFSLRGTVGQPDAGSAVADARSLFGGYWAVPKEGDLFADGFESGDLSAWSSVVGQPTMIAGEEEDHERK